MRDCFFHLWLITSISLKLFRCLFPNVGHLQVCVSMSVTQVSYSSAEASFHVLNVPRSALCPFLWKPTFIAMAPTCHTKQWAGFCFPSGWCSLFAWLEQSGKAYRERRVPRPSTHFLLKYSFEPLALKDKWALTRKTLESIWNSKQDFVQYKSSLTGRQ